MSELTAEQIDAMPAGRELDLLVAEKVLGWKPCPPGHFTTVEESVSIVRLHMERTHHWRLQSPFEAGGPTAGPGNTYWAGLTPHGCTGWNGRPDYQAPGETLALAICRAALRCVLELVMPYDGLGVADRFGLGKRCPYCLGTGSVKCPECEGNGFLRKESEEPK